MARARRQLRGATRALVGRDRRRLATERADRGGARVALGAGARRRRPTPTRALLHRISSAADEPGRARAANSAARRARWSVATGGGWRHRASEARRRAGGAGSRGRRSTMTRRRTPTRALLRRISSAADEPGRARAANAAVKCARWSVATAGRDTPRDRSFTSGPRVFVLHKTVGVFVAMGIERTRSIIVFTVMMMMMN